MSTWDDDALADLRHHQVLKSAHAAPIWDSRNSVSAESAAALRDLITADYARKPVPRQGDTR